MAAAQRRSGPAAPAPPGVLLDWQLFRRIRAAAKHGGAAGAADLRRALELVRGEPLAGAELPYSSGYRNPYTWLPGSDVQSHASAVVDTAHQLVDLCSTAGDVPGRPMGSRTGVARRPGPPRRSSLGRRDARCVRRWASGRAGCAARRLGADP